jgi:hypothetical protein
MARYYPIPSSNRRAFTPVVYSRTLSRPDESETHKGLLFSEEN